MGNVFVKRQKPVYPGPAAHSALRSNEAVADKDEEVPRADWQDIEEHARPVEATFRSVAVAEDVTFGGDASRIGMSFANAPSRPFTAERTNRKLFSRSGQARQYSVHRDQTEFSGLQYDLQPPDRDRLPDRARLSTAPASRSNNAWMSLRQGQHPSQRLPLDHKPQSDCKQHVACQTGPLRVSVPPARPVYAMPSTWQRGETLGAGAFGTVFVAMNSDSGELFAVKEVTAASAAESGEAVQQLESEVALMTSLDHPNIVRYVGTQRLRDSLFIFLEYVPGGSIASVLKRFGVLQESCIRSFTRQVLAGLAYLHAQNTVHRDVKGANILLEKDGRVKLADFGMAKQLLERISVSKSLKGTPAWMAPEVVRAQGHGLAADIWSLGCTLLEMATGKPPWSDCSTQVQAMFKIANSSELPPIPEHLSPDAAEFILLCLQRDPLARPTAAALLTHPFVQFPNSLCARVPPALQETEPVVITAVKLGVLSSEAAAPEATDEVLRVDRPEAVGDVSANAHYQKRDVWSPTGRMSPAVLEQMAFGDPFVRPASAATSRPSTSTAQPLYRGAAGTGASEEACGGDEDIFVIPVVPTLFQVTGFLSMPLVQQLDGHHVPQLSLRHQQLVAIRDQQAKARLKEIS